MDQDCVSDVGCAAKQRTRTVRFCSGASQGRWGPSLPTLLQDYPLWTGGRRSSLQRESLESIAPAWLGHPVFALSWTCWTLKLDSQELLALLREEDDRGHQQVDLVPEQTPLDEVGRWWRSA